jgi:putative oxidoreductase
MEHVMESLHDASSLSVGLLLIRLIAGTLLVAHGAQKLFGWFGGYGLAGTGGYLETLGYRPGRFFAAAAGLAEFSGGILLALGFLGPIASALIIPVMIVATVTVHWKNGVFATSNGIELTLLYATIALAVALTGPGRYSLDAALGLERLWSPGLEWAAIVIGILGGVANLILRRSAPQVSQTA